MGLFSKFSQPRDDDEEAKAPERSGPADVTLYSTSWCASCFMAKRYLDQKGVSYDEIDIDLDPEAAQKVMSLAHGYKTVPTMIIGDSVVVDWDRRALEKALANEGILTE
jgi:mycoredoxin